MKRLASMVLVVSFAVTGIARDEFGPLSEAKAKYPEFFEAGAVLESSLGNATWYVYCGDAEKCFSEETDSELFQEAEIQAKTNFYEYFVKREKTTSVNVTVNGARRMYEFADGAMRYVVMGAPKAAVQVSVPQAMPVPVKPAPTARTTMAESTPLPIGGVSAPESTPVADKVEAEPKESSETIETSQPAPVNSPEGNREIDDEEKLNVLRARLEKKPGDFNVRMRMARIFARQGKPKRAVRNYADAVRIMVADDDTGREEKADAVCEVAEFEEKNNAEALALKHFRVLQRIGNQQQSAKATGRISLLLLHYK